VERFPAPVVAAGTHSYRVRVVDPFGNPQTSPAVSVTVAGTGNTAPVARFTTEVNGRTLSADGTSSTDADGTITDYAWTWGDGQGGTGPTAVHGYAADGSYTVGLTVTDNGGARHSTTRVVTVGDPPAVLASDAFTRTVGSGLGTADTGGPWTTNGSGFSVNGSQGVVTVAGGGQGPWAQLAGVSSSSVEVTAAVVLDKRPNTAAVYVGTIGRRVGAADYRLKLKIDANGAVTIYGVRLAGGETTLQSQVVPGLMYTAGSRLNTRLQVTGTSPTTLRAKVWLSSTPEPASWQVSATDSTAALQTTGSVGLHTYVSSSATNAPWPIRFDDFVVRPL
jgi:PKD repeat protein